MKQYISKAQTWFYLSKNAHLRPVCGKGGNQGGNKEGGVGPKNPKEGEVRQTPKFPNKGGIGPKRP